jgi:hypothetical protein
MNYGGQESPLWKGIEKEIDEAITANGGWPIK